jgi:hypothetical protein
MDSFRELAAEPEPAFGSHAPDPVEVSSAGDERRMQVRAYNYWASLLAGRDFPSIEDLEPASIADFAKNSVLLDFTSGPENPTTAYVGVAVRRECDLDLDVESLAEGPAGSLLARLAGYYEQILANRAPVGIEADFVNQRGQSVCYRGILMPFSSDGDTIDFAYGVFNWAGGETAEETPSRKKAKQPINLDAAAAEHIAWEDGPLADSGQSEDEPAVEDQTLELSAVELDAVESELLEPDALELEEQVEAGEPAPVDSPAPCLSDWLHAARATAEDAKFADGRSRHALYQALGQAYDFACAAVQHPEEYDALLADAEIAVQARAPMTAVAKLVFGSDYDKARLTEYAAALSFAARQSVDSGGFLDFIEAQPGGLKGLVEAERRVRRPDADGSAWRERAWTMLREARPRPLEALAGNGEFALVLVRRDANGEVSPVASVPDMALLDRAIRKASS